MYIIFFTSVKLRPGYSLGETYDTVGVERPESKQTHWKKKIVKLSSLDSYKHQLPGEMIGKNLFLDH